MRATLDGFDLGLGSGAGWSIIPGTGAHVRVFPMPLEMANAVFAQATLDGSTIQLDSTGAGEPGGSQTAKLLTVLGTGPTNHPEINGVTVADQRWRWNRPHHKRAYNIRRRTGERRRVFGGDVPLAAQAIADDVAFAPWSLNPATSLPWTAEETVRDVFEGLIAGLGIGGADLIEYRKVSEAVAGIPVEGLEIDDACDSAIARVLAYLGGRLSVYIDWSGKIVVYDVLDGGEAQILGQTTPGGTKTAADPKSAAGEGIILTPASARQDRKLERPSAIRFLFGTLAELRLNFDEVQQSDPAATQGAENSEAKLDNVFTTPEDLVLADGSAAVQGQVLTFPATFLAWKDTTNNGPKPVPTLPDISVDLIRRRWLSPLTVAYVWEVNDRAGKWRRRIASVRSSYRLAFQVQQYWRDRIREYRPSLLSVEDFETGVKGKAAVYADHSIYQAVRWFNSKRLADQPEKHQIFRNVLANEASGPGAILTTKIGDLLRAPANVSVADQELGLLSVSYDTDFTGQAVQVFRSAFDPEKIPSDDTREVIAHDGTADFTKEHELSIVLTCVPAAPNDKSQLFAIEIKPVDLGGVIFGLGIGEALGPVLEIRVPSATQAARFAWPNSREGLKESEQGAWEAFAEGGETMQTGYGEPTNLRQLNAIARAQATAIYSRFLDRVEGGLTTALIQDQQIVGNLSGISAEVKEGDDGGALSVFTSTPEGPSIDFVSLLPAGLRRIIFREVDSKP